MIQTIGKAYRHKNGMAVQTACPPVDNLSDEVIVLWSDRRMISPEQRRKAWALVGEISAAYGYLSASDKKQINVDLKRKFLMEYVDQLTADAIKAFSLSDIDMSTARLYIDFLIQFILEHGIATQEPLYRLADDIGAYVYGCMLNRRCAVCGKHADIHHVDRIGMGGNRDKMSHIGMRALPLCRMHHREAHDHGDETLMDKYHLQPIVIDEKIAKELKLGKRQNMED